MIKFVNLLKEALNEILEMTKGYPYKHDGTTSDRGFITSKYSFSSPKNNYEVVFNQVLDVGVDKYDNYDKDLRMKYLHRVELYFKVGGHHDKDTNEGVVTDVLSTVINITSDFLKQYKPHIIQIDPSKSASDIKTDLKKGGKPDSNKRSDIYSVFLEKNIGKIPEIKNYNVEKYGKIILLVKKEDQKNADT